MAAKDGGAMSEFLFSFGVSVLPLCVAAIASKYHAPHRLTWTLVGAYLAAYWLAPVNFGKLILGVELKGDIEMFLLSGVMVVISSTLIIVNNAQLLTTFFNSNGGESSRYRFSAVLGAMTVAVFAGAVALGDAFDGIGQLLYLFGLIMAGATALAVVAVRFPSTAPALKMGVAYPLSNRFRTGMTIAMFSLIVFSLSVFSALNNSFNDLITANGGDGGWDILTTTTRNSEMTDLTMALKDQQAPVAGDIESTGRTTMFTADSAVRVSGDNAEAKPFPVLAADDAFLTMKQGQLGSTADGYGSERDVFNAVASHPNLGADRPERPAAAASTTTT